MSFLFIFNISLLQSQYWQRWYWSLWGETNSWRNLLKEQECLQNPGSISDPLWTEEYYCIRIQLRMFSIGFTYAGHTWVCDPT